MRCSAKYALYVTDRRWQSGSGRVILIRLQQQAAQNIFNSSLVHTACARLLEQD